MVGLSGLMALGPSFDEEVSIDWDVKWKVEGISLALSLLQLER